MTSVTITVLLLIIGGFIAFAIYLQLKEQARLEKMRKVVTLNNQLRQVTRYLDDIPSQYQPKDMRLWLFSRLISIYDQLLVLQPDPTLSRRRRNIEEEMTAFQANTQKRSAKPMNEELLNREVKSLDQWLKTSLLTYQADQTNDFDFVKRYSN